MTRQLPIIDFHQAQNVVQAAVKKANELKVPVFATVIDAVGQTVASARVDGANYFAERISKGKAITAVGMGAPTEVWEDLSRANPEFAGGITSVPDFTPFAGGIPLKIGELLIGAVGISGGTSAEDIEIAIAAADALS